MKKRDQASGITSEASVNDAYTTSMNLAEEKRKQTWYTEAILEYRNAIRLAEGLRSIARIAEALYFIGICEVRLTNLDSALANFHEARRLFQRSRNRERVADCYGNETYVHRMRADYKTAHQLAQKALTIYEKTENKTRVAMIHQNIGAIYIEQKRPRKATTSMHLALQLMSEAGNHEFANNVRIDLAKVIYGNGVVDESMEMLNQVIQEAKQRNLTVQLAQALFSRGNMLPSLQQYDVAINDLVEATEHFRYLGDKRFEVLSLTNLGSIRNLKGDNEPAKVDLEAAIQLSCEIKLPLLEHYAIRALAMVNHNCELHAIAAAQIDRTVAFFHELGNPREENLSVFLRGLWNAELGLKEEATLDFERSLTFCLQNPCHGFSVRTFFSAAYWFAYWGDTVKARELKALAEKQFNKHQDRFLSFQSLFSAAMLLISGEKTDASKRKTFVARYVAGRGNSLSSYMDRIYATMKQLHVSAHSDTYFYYSHLRKELLALDLPPTLLPGEID